MISIVCDLTVFCTVFFSFLFSFFFFFFAGHLIFLLSYFINLHERHRVPGQKEVVNRLKSSNSSQTLTRLYLTLCSFMAYCRNPWLSCDIYCENDDFAIVCNITVIYGDFAILAYFSLVCFVFWQFIPLFYRFSPLTQGLIYTV